MAAPDRHVVRYYGILSPTVGPTAKGAPEGKSRLSNSSSPRKEEEQEAALLTVILARISICGDRDLWSKSCKCPRL